MKYTFTNIRDSINSVKATLENVSYLNYMCDTCVKHVWSITHVTHTTVIHVDNTRFTYIMQVYISYKYV